MAVYRYAELTWEEMGNLLQCDLMAILPVGALEAHGPHLPLATDVIIAEAMANAGAGRLAAAGREVVILPPLVFTAASFADGFPGTLSLPADTITQLVFDITVELANRGVSCLGIANAHFDPEHLKALRHVEDRVREVPIRFVHPNLTRKPWASRLTDEFKSGAAHAGQYETSIVMAARPELVRDDLRAALPDHPVSLSDAIRAGHRSFEDAGGDRAYFGYPASATAEEGATTIDTLGHILAEAMLDDTP